MTTPALLHIYTDGACSGNPGPGGWGVWMEYPDDTAATAGESFSGGAPDTTNNRMELQAIIEALRQLQQRDRPYEVHLFSDSEYIIRAINEWLDGWRRRNFRRADRKPVKNTDLWMQFDRLRQDYENRHAVKIRWQWVRGHAGNHGNEIANTLAQEAAARAAPKQAGGTAGSRKATIQ